MFHRFRYESKFAATLDRLPLYVRMKLDVTGIKLSLQDWLAFGFEERQAICHLPVENEEEQKAFTAYLDFLCRKYFDRAVATLAPVNASLWESSRVPEAVAERTSRGVRSVTPQEWSRWQFHERYALYKTAISKSEPEKFYAVLAELRERTG